MAENYLKNIDPEVLKLIKAIRCQADRYDLPAYMVGGFVRDLLLKKKSSDLDIAVEGSAITFARGIAIDLKAEIKTYKKFGTAAIILPDGLSVDFASVRKETYSRPGALPLVKPGSLEEDLKRRDFSINAMAICINQGKFGRLIDVCGGVQDLQNKYIKVMHDKSFIDDPTRILRAVKFEQRLDFHIEAHTRQLLKKAIDKKAVKTVKLPRYFAEFQRLLQETYPVKGLKCLGDLGALSFIHTDLKMDFDTLLKIQKNLRKHADSILVQESKDTLWLVYFIAMLQGFKSTALADVAIKFQFNREKKLAILSCTKTSLIIKELSAKDVASSDVYKILKPLDRRFILYLRMKIEKKSIRQRIDRFVEKDDRIKTELSGYDLHRLGLRTGCKIGLALEELLHRKIDRKIETLEDEIQFIKQKFNER